MTGLQRASSFTTVCSFLGIVSGVLVKLLQLAGVSGRIMEYLESCGNAPAVLIHGIKEEADRQRRRSYPASWEAITLADVNYPERLRHISLPPAILFVSGMN